MDCSNSIGKKYGEKIKFIFILQSIIFIQALGNLSSKVAAIVMERDGIFNWDFIILIGVYFGVMAFYAVAWQLCIEKVEISFAYANRSLGLLWSQFFAVTIFKEELYFNNIIGIALIIIGVWVVNKDAN